MQGFMVKYVIFTDLQLTDQNECFCIETVTVGRIVLLHASHNDHMKGNCSEQTNCSLDAHNLLIWSIVCSCGILTGFVKTQ